LHILDVASWDDGIAHEWKDEAAAEDMGMPVRTLREHRRNLAELGYITCIQKQYNQDIVIRNWTNPREYSGQIYNQGDTKLEAQKSQGDTQGDTQGDRKHVTPTSNSKNQRIKKNNADKPAKPETPHEIKLFREVTERYPNKINYPDVISIIQGVCKRLGRDCISEDLRPFYAAWCAKGYKPVNLAWLSWAESGIIPQQAKQQTEQPKGFGAIQQWLQSKQEAYGNAD
jgi:hypothetical protein